MAHTAHQRLPIANRLDWGYLGEDAKIAPAPTGGPARSAMNWFLDAATYARDGDIAEAKAAALAGIEALNDPHTPA